MSAPATTRVHVCRYGADAIATLAHVVGAAQRTDPLAPVTVLVPSNVAGLVARRALARVQGQHGLGVAGLQLATLDRLAESLAVGALATRRPATGPVVAAAWRSALRRAPGVFAPVVDHPATVRALVAAHRELRDCSPTALDAVATASPVDADLVRLHRDVRQLLHDEWYDQTDLLTLAADLVAADPHAPALTAAGRLVLYLPQDLTQAAGRLAGRLRTTVGVDIVVALTGVRRADRVVRRSLDRMGVPTHDPVRDDDETAPAVAADSTALGRPSAPPVAHEVRHASDSDAEVRMVVRQVVQALESTPADRIAVLYTAAQPYARLLHEHLAAAGLTVSGAGVRPVAERPLARAFLDILALAPADLPRAPLFAALAEARTRDLCGDRVPVARWERLSRTAAVVAGAEWDERLAAYADGAAAELDRLRALREAGADVSTVQLERLQRQQADAGALRTFALGLRARLGAGSALTTWPALAEWARELFHDLYGGPADLGALPPEDQYAATVVLSTLDATAELGTFESTAELTGLIDVLTQELEQALPRVGRFGTGIFVASLREAVGLDADAVFVLGLAEDIYPGRLRDDALLPDHVRTGSDGELPALRDTLDGRQRQLLAAFDAAPRVVATLPRGDLRRSTLRLPSQWLMPTLRARTGDHDLAATDWLRSASDHTQSEPSFAAGIVSAALPATAQEWRTQAARTGRPFADDVVEAASAMLRARAGSRFTRFDGDLSGVDGLPDFAHDERTVSPTALETYADCPHAYFVRRLLRVEPVDQPEELVTISALDRGNLVHQTMDRFISGCGPDLPDFGRPWTAPQRARLRAIAGATGDEFERRGLTGHQALWAAERLRILAVLDSMLDDDDRQRALDDAAVRGSELEFGAGGVPPIEVDLADGGRVRFRGSADKVDQARDGTLIVTDIKTGSTSRYDAMRRDVIAHGTKLQLPVYARAAIQLLGRPDTPARATYWFVRYGKRIDVELTPELDARFVGAVATLVHGIAGGSFPAKAPETPDFKWVQCRFCNPDGLGHGEVRSRWERKRTDPALAPLVALIDPLEGPTGGAA